LKAQRVAYPLFCVHLFEDVILHTEIRDDSLQPAVLLLQRPQPPRLGDLAKEEVAGSRLTVGLKKNSAELSPATSQGGVEMVHSYLVW
jgi:hypothetical protein